LRSPQAIFPAFLGLFLDFRGTSPQTLDFQLEIFLSFEKDLQIQRPLVSGLIKDGHRITLGRTITGTRENIDLVAPLRYRDRGREKPSAAKRSCVAFCPWFG
jgi:hypothetical protein